MLKRPPVKSASEYGFFVHDYSAVYVSLSGPYLYMGAPDSPQISPVYKCSGA